MSNADGIKVNKTETKKVVKKLSSPVATYVIVGAVAALVVGGAVYSWQKKLAKDEALKLKKMAVEEKSMLEKRIDSLKEKITGIESENEKMKNLSVELEEKNKLLQGARKTYKNNDLKFAFEYPALFEDVKLNNDGKIFLGNFLKNEKVSFGGASEEYVSTSSINILQAKGYIEKDKNFYLRLSDDDKTNDIMIKPIKAINTGKGKALIVDQKSFSKADGSQVDVGLGGNVAAIVNLNGDKFKGVAFLNSDFGMMPMAQFEEMIKTIK